MTSVKRRRDKVDILGFDVAGKLSDDIVKNTAMASNTVILKYMYHILKISF
jgi:hypothetical protein